MRFQYHYFITGLVLLLCSQAALAIRHPLILRQDDTASESSRSPATTNVESSSKPSDAASSRESSATPTRSQIRSDASTTSTPSSVTVTTSSQAHAAVTSGGSQASASGNPDANVLPIQPTITPAMGLTGAILLLSGAVYAVIGIKTKWLYVFFSAAYLTGLAVTVLIIYLMNPPVSNAVQGGFFVAAFLTGVIFGAVSLVFPDITEGLGCLLGGFCLSMWFLTLKEDGLIMSKTGRAIFIGCMSFAGFSLSFSHYTRTYGLIACISFAGSTITMLGIDCFSRAGWKEFWLYLWDLNDQTFPLNTNTYPLTRGIKVEVACVVLMSAMGIISQLKLWRVVKERREKNAAQRLQRDEDTKREEEELGRRIETDMSRERARWEAAYGNKNTQQDSVMEVSEKSTPKTSTSIRNQERSLPSSTESVEMVSLPPTSSTGVQGIPRSGSKNTQSGPTVTVTVLPEEDEIQQIDHDGNVVRSQENPLLASDDAPTNTNASTRTSTDYGASGSSNLPRTTSTRSSLRSSLPPPPAIVPLPFRIPQEADETLDDDNASVSAVPESIHQPASTHRPLSKRLSGGSMMKRFSAHRNSLDETENESLIIPHIEDDRASSLAATLDEEDDNVSLAEISAPSSPLQSGFGIGIAGERETHLDTTPKSSDESNKNDNAASAAARRSLTVSTDPQSKPHQANRASLNSPRQAYDAMTSVAEEEAERSPHSKSKSAAPSVNSHTESQVGLSENALPKNMSRIAMSYRTNEWAKHLEVAENPSLDDITEPESPGVQVSHDFDERPAPVSDEIKGVRPKLEARKSKRTSAGSAPFRNLNVVRSSSNMSRNSLADAQQSQNRGKRSSSTPFPGQSLEAAGSRLSNTPSPIPSNTLMGQRETLVRNRITSHSFSPQISSTNISAEVDQENMTLAQRRQLIQQQKPPSASQTWRQSSSAGEAKAQVYDSHQPRRSSGGIDTSRRETMLANWRDGIRQSSSPGPKATSPTEDSRRMALVNEKRQKEMERQQKAVEKQQRESMLDNMMRSGGMQDAHREALRRMQAKANRSAS